MLSGSISYDGRSWQAVGEIESEWLSAEATVGLLLNSGLGDVTTEIVLDHVQLT
jgi:hypothetical protein